MSPRRTAPILSPFDLLHLTQQRIPPLAHVVWMGDFNAHLDQANSSSPHVSSDLLPALNCDLPSADPPARKSLDTRKVDSYGRKLLQFCGDRDLTILYGCTPGDSQGFFTYEKGLVRSVIDYAIVSQSLWPLVRNFQVDYHNPVLSDHSLIRLELNMAGSQYVTHPRAEGHSPLLKLIGRLRLSNAFVFDLVPPSSPSSYNYWKLDSPSRIRI